MPCSRAYGGEGERQTEALLLLFAILQRCDARYDAFEMPYFHIRLPPREAIDEASCCRRRHAAARSHYADDVYELILLTSRAPPFVTMLRR